MSYLGSWKIDDLLTFTVVTTRVDTGAATDADAAPAYRVYEDETATPILTGTMATLDAANTAGFYSEQITLSAANGFEKGKSYNIYISATVNSVAGATVRNLQIEAEVDANSVSNIGAGVITATAIADGAIDAGAIAADAITAAKIADGAIDANTFAAGAITATVIADGAIDAATFAAGAIDAAAMNVTGSEFTAIPWNAAWDAEVQSEVEDALVVHRLDELLNADSDIDGAAPPTVGSVFHELMTKTTGSFTYDQTTDALEALRDRGDAAWITATGFSTHSAADVWAAATRTLTSISDSAGVTTLLTRITAALEVYTAANIRSAVGLASANMDTQLDALPTNAELTTALAGADDAVLAAIAALNNLSAAQVNAEVVDALVTDVLADSIATDGSRPTIAQALLLIYRFLLERSVSGTTMTVKKEDGSTTSATFTINDASSPTSITRAS